MNMNFIKINLFPSVIQLIKTITFEYTHIKQIKYTLKYCILISNIYKAKSNHSTWAFLVSMYYSNRFTRGNLIEKITFNSSLPHLFLYYSILWIATVI